ncbi:MAG: hypothetical protein SYR96_27345 [Actinomycetota bacterium]|nr:hypothetical protein [Actinomycetota bacterium]
MNPADDQTEAPSGMSRRTVLGGAVAVAVAAPLVAGVALVDRRATGETFEAAARHASDGARTLAYNKFQPALLRRTLVRALTELSERR